MIWNVGGRNTWTSLIRNFIQHTQKLKMCIWIKLVVGGGVGWGGGDFKTSLSDFLCFLCDVWYLYWSNKASFKGNALYQGSFHMHDSSLKLLVKEAIISFVAPHSLLISSYILRVFIGRHLSTFSM